MPADITVAVSGVRSLRRARSVVPSVVVTCCDLLSLAVGQVAAARTGRSPRPARWRDVGGEHAGHAVLYRPDAADILGRDARGRVPCLQLRLVDRDAGGRSGPRHHTAATPRQGPAARRAGPASPIGRSPACCGDPLSICWYSQSSRYPATVLKFPELCPISGDLTV